MDKGIKRLWLVFLLPLVVVFAGTAGFMILEKLSFIDAFYLTVVTISTVGYGDIYPTSTASKVFCVVLLFVGVGSFVAIATNLTQTLVARGQNNLRKQRINMLIGLFFTEFGNQLLKILVRGDPNLSSFRSDFHVKDNWTSADFRQLKQKVEIHEYIIDPKLADFEYLRGFLKENGDFIARQIENPDLTERESFTELLWATLHLRDELMARNSLRDLPGTDLGHLANDTKRAYNLLVRQWIDYLEYLKRRYPYLLSLALRTNPFMENTSTVIH